MSGPDLFETYFLILMLTATVLPGKRVLVGPLIGTAILMVQKSFFSFGGYFDKIVLGARPHPGSRGLSRAA